MSAPTLTAALAVKCWLSGLRIAAAAGPVRRRVMLGTLAVAASSAAFLAFAMWFTVWLTAPWVELGLSTWRGWTGWIGRAATLVGIFAAAPVWISALANLVWPTLFDSIFAASRTLVAPGSPPPRAATFIESVRDQFARIGRYAVYAAATLPLLLIPAIGTPLFAATQMALSAAALGEELCFSHAQAENWEKTRWQRFARENRFGIWAFGCCCALALWIPVIQWLGPGVAACSAGALSGRLHQQSPGTP